MQPWAAEYPALEIVTCLADLVGGLGILLPSVTRIRPGLVLLAALGLCVLQAEAMMFHLSSGATRLATMNLVLLALSCFVLWGRGEAAPIVARA